MGNNTIFTTNLYILILICYITSTISYNNNNNNNNNDGNETLLSVGFYDRSCPRAESIITKVMIKSFLNDSGIAASILRLHFHDCFVNGCDASILLDKTPSGKEIEKKSPGNIGVRGFEVIDEAKAQLEKACPNTVSCADIIAYAARDAATLSGIAPYEVPGGRRDGLKSLSTDVFGNLPVPNSDVGQMEEIFAKKGMNKADLVTLLGVHSIGVAHCSLFDEEFFDFNATHQWNPKLNTQYALFLRTVCPKPKSPESNDNNVLPLNVNNMGNKLSTLFYNNVVAGRVVIPADQSLLDDEFTSKMVKYYVVKSWKWGNDFKDAMVKMGYVDVLTGTQGEIRKTCRFVNN